MDEVSIKFGIDELCIILAALSEYDYQIDKLKDSRARYSEDKGNIKSAASKVREALARY